MASTAALLLAVAAATRADNDEIVRQASLGVACDQCLPCLTPPCYKDDGVHAYSKNTPGSTYTSSSPCWQQRLQNAALQNTYPPKSGSYAERCTCGSDWVEFQTVPNGVDTLGRQVWRQLTWYHRFCGPSLLASQEHAGGPQQIFECMCQPRTHVRTQIPIYLLANVSVGSRVDVPGGAPRELVTDRRVVELADGSLVPIDADSTARPARDASPPPSSNATAANAPSNLTDASQSLQRAPSDSRRPDRQAQHQLQPAGGGGG